MSTRKDHARRHLPGARERYEAALSKVTPELALPDWLSSVQATLAAARDYRDMAREAFGAGAELAQIATRVQQDTAAVLGRLQEVQRAMSILTDEEQRAKATEEEIRAAEEVAAALRGKT